MKFLRIFTRVFLGLIIIFSVLFTMLIGKSNINQTHSSNSEKTYKGILTVWQIDSFEGGTGSRKQFLLKCARSFEYKNQGVLIMVIEHTEQSFKKEMLNNNYPDLISFGTGIEVSGFSELNLKNGRGGVIGKKTFAVPWCRGGYVLIANPKLTSEIPDKLDSLMVSQGEYSQPLTALYLEGITSNNLVVKQPMDAYVDFVAGKTPYLLGTQRDINRLERRQMEVITRPLEKFNDIYQYIAVTAKDSTKAFYAESFIEHLLCEKNQLCLKEIGMMSSCFEVEYYNQHLSKMQKLENFSTVSAFSNASLLKEMQQNSRLLLGGQKELEIKIKNMLI